MPLYVCVRVMMFISVNPRTSYMLLSHYISVCLIMSYLSAPEPTLWSALPVRDKSTAQHTDPCPPHNPSLALAFPYALLQSCLLAPPLRPPVTSPFLSLNWVLHTLLLPGLIPSFSPLFFSLLLFFPPFLKTRGSDLSAFLYFSELWYIKMHVNAEFENRGMAERSTKTVLLLRTVLNCSSISFCRNLEVISLLLNMQYILYSI